MLYSFNWLKELSQTKKSAQAVAEELTLRSFEVEDVEEIKNDWEKIIIGEIKAIKKHPQADRLQIVSVDLGKQKLDLVTGAPNVEMGQKVPVALEGAKLANGLKIKATVLRGVESRGMLCAEDELGLGDDHSGIMILDDKAPVGKKLADYLKIKKDAVLEIDILPNRAHDCLNYRGVAREISAVEGRKFNDKIKKEAEQEWEKIKKFPNQLSAKIDTNNCQRYTGVYLKKVKIKASPFWMRARLRASGIQPINNVVDITNYVMLETGQPLHAFSAEKINKIIIRQAQEKEKIKLLDGQELKLSKEDMVISDGEKPIALAGVMGGENSAIQENTSAVILEGASFQASAIRRTARYHNLSTEASYRFERNLDPNLTQMAVARATQLLKELAEVEIKSWQDIYPQKVKPWTIELETEKVNQLSGIDILVSQIKNILEQLGLQVSGKNKVLKVAIPTERLDLQNQEDLIEEVGRLYGYEKIKPIPLQGSIVLPQRNEKRFFEREIKDICVANAWNEIKGYSFYSSADAKALGLDQEKHLALLNPATTEQAWMRQTLAIALLKATRVNISHFKNIRLFEIGRVYYPQKSGLPQEKEKLGASMASIDTQGEQFYELKGLAENIFERIGLNDYYWDDNLDKKELKIASHAFRRALIKTNQGKVLGWLVEISAKTTQYFGIKRRRVAVLEMDMELLRTISLGERSYQPLKKFPPVNRDISLKVPAYTRVADVERIIYQSGGKYLQDVDLFDLYINEDNQERSLGFHLIFQSEEKTLSSQEVETLMQKIFQALEKELGAEIKKN